uniref:Beta-glucosidase n=1 Tax=Timema bartmani TaxID=61472 RepID=A0A7R9EWT6_9NEOP|nr:unnamed protein product [Timema bartmani]
MIATGVVVCFTLLGCVWGQAHNSFPEGFMFGAATAAYQVEGAWNTSGKGESIWDRFVHNVPDCIANHQTGDVAADSYHLYPQDIQALKDVGFGHYRFSISWPRVMPTGDVTDINQDGIDYYNKVIDALLADNITPMVTMYHWDLPQSLQDLGGWTNPIMVDYFEDYARVLYDNFGDRVKWWITFNEPLTFVAGYTSGGCTPPQVNAPDVGNYLVAHTVIKSHARAYHLYDDNYRDAQNGQVGITLNTGWFLAANGTEQELQLAEYTMQSTLGWFAHPIYSKEGDYPAILKETVANQSRAEGRYRSRLPEFDEYWINYIRGSADFLGLNHYGSTVLSAGDGGVQTLIDPSWPKSSATWLLYTPFGMRPLLNWMKQEYDNSTIIITENGWGDEGELNDTIRSNYYLSYLAGVVEAINLDNVNVIGHTSWSIIDNFEWASGFTIKFGLYSVDYDDASRPRTPKASAGVLADIISSNQIPEEIFEALHADPYYQMYYPSSD